MTDLKPLEDAPFGVYLQILRENNHEEDAEITEMFYVDLLTTIKSSDGREFTREQIMKTPFKNLTKAIEIILDETQRELPEKPPRMNLPGGTALMGAGADKLSEEDLRYLMMKQSQLHEENKLKQAVT